MEHIMMACGHSANAQHHNIATDKWEPACVICGCYETSVAPNLDNRMARCSCGKVVPSSLDLAFFEYCGAGSHNAGICKNCHYAEIAHKNPKHQCKNYEAQGDRGYDRYYCGCMGWD